MNFEDFEISDETAQAYGDAAGVIYGLITTGTPAMALAPIVDVIVTGGLKLTNAGYKVQGLGALQKKAAAIERLPDLKA